MSPFRPVFATLVAVVLMVPPVFARGNASESAQAPAVAATAPAAVGPPDAATNDIFSSNVYGSRGGYHTFAARPLSPGALVLSVNDNYTSSSRVFSRTDFDVQSTLGIALLWSPLAGFEVGLNQISTINKYTDGLSSTLQLQGNPSLLLKYVAPMTAALGLGGLFVWTAPTSAGGNGVDIGASTLKVAGLASYRVHEFVEITANLGYIYDRSSRLFSESSLSALERYVYGINDHQSRAVYGLAAVGQFEVQQALGISPFLEFSGEYSGDLSAGRNPFNGTLGVKAFPWGSRTIEGILGVDVRMGGAPQLNGSWPGLPNWLLFGQITFHIDDSNKSGTARTCSATSACGSGQSCEDGVCVVVKEVPVEKVVEKEVVKAPPMVHYVGGVFDAETGQPLAGAEVTAAGQADSITVNSTTGKFTLCPVPADGGILRVTAHALGYVDEELTVARSAAAGGAPIAFHMHPTGNPVTGTFKGSVRDGSTGKPIAGVSVSVPAASLKVPLQEDGSFDVTLKVGRYQVLVSAPDYETQKKEVQISHDQVVIVDIDLLPKAAGGALKSLKTLPAKKK